MRSRILMGGILSLVLAVAPIYAQRPPAPQLLPRDTLAYLRIADTRELVAAFQNTGMGRLMNDDQVRPLLQGFYGSITEPLAGVEQRLGLTLVELLEIPQGELCFALVAPEQGRPAGLILMDVGHNLPVAERLIQDRGQRLIRDGGRRIAEAYRGVELVSYEHPDRPGIHYFVQDDTVVLSPDYQLLEQLIDVWHGSDAAVLADNGRFTTIMNRSRGTQNEAPQLSWFVDPMEMARRYTAGDFVAAAGVAMVSALGLDGLYAVGGSLILDAEQFDSIIHVHVMTANPREGILRALAFGSGETTPEPWVPGDAANYTTVHLNTQRIFETGVEVYENFRSQGAFELEVLPRFFDQWGVDLERDVIDQLEGRLTMFGWVDHPPRLNGQATVMGMKLKDPAGFQATLATIIETTGADVQRQSLAGVQYYHAPARASAEDRLTRRPQPAVAVMGGYLVLSDSVEALQEAIRADQGAAERLATAVDYRLVSSRVTRHAEGKPVSMLSFRRPEVTMRHFYELALRPEARDRLAESEGNPFAGAIHETLQGGPLPPFPAIARYLAPHGAILVDEPAGVHFMLFGLKRE